MNQRITFLIENELERAEIILAAKALTDTLQDVAEKVAKMDAQDVMPLSDPMTTYFSAEQARSFGDNVSEQLRGLTAKIKEVRDAISAEIGKMEGTVNGEPMNDITASADAPSEFPTDEIPAPDGEGEDIEGMADDMDMAADEEMPEMPGLGDEIDDTKHAAGRGRKDAPHMESAKSAKKVLESVDRVVARQFGRMIKEGVSSRAAAHKIMENYALTIDDLITIISAHKKA